MNEDQKSMAALITERVGLVLPPEKEYLIQTRLAPVLEQFAVPDLRAACDHMRDDQDFSDAICDAILTHETTFFRERDALEALTGPVLHEIARHRRLAPDEIALRIWSAGCSTGQEPYSIAMQLQRHSPKLAARAKIVATDVSPLALQRGRAGLYTDFEIQRGLPEEMREYFEKVPGGLRVIPMLRDRIEFKQHNLVRDPLLKTFDVIFLRNTVIYFAPPDRARVYGGMGDCLAPDGVLFLGAAENPLGELPRGHIVRRHQRSIYFEFNSSNIKLF